MRTAIVLATALVCLPTAAAHPPCDVEPAPLPDPRRALEAWATVNVTTALEGMEVSGVLRLEGTAAAQPGYRIHHVRVEVDRRIVGHAEGTSNWSFTLDTRLLVDGPHVLHVYAMAAPDLPLFLFTRGWGVAVRFSTFNHEPGVTLYERSMDFTGAGAEAWTLRLQEDYVGLRVTVRTEATNASLLAPRALMVVTHKDGTGNDSRALRTWTATYGLLEGSASISEHPRGVLHQGGILAMHGAVAGEGRLHVKVEAVPKAARNG